MNTGMWFMLACSCILLEVGHPGLLYFLALAGGAGVACLVSWLEYSAMTQSIVFFAASIIAVGLVYLWVQYAAVHDTKSHRSNTDLLVGKIVAIVAIQSAKIGQGTVGGEAWLVKLQGEGELKVGMKAIVLGVQGCHLQIREVQN